MLSNRRRNEIRLLSGRETSEPYQENTGDHASKAEHELTEVLIDGDENPTRGIGTVDALVSKQPHATDLGSG